MQQRHFEAQALRADYPGIDEYLNGHTTADAAGSAPYSLDMLLSASYVLPPSMNFDGPEPWPRRYTQVYEDLINLIINFAMISHSGLTLSEINRRIFFDFTFLHDGQSPTHYRYELYSGLMHQPSKTGYVIEPCAGNLVINNSINGKDLLLSPPPVLSAIWGEKSTVRCNQFFKAEDIIGGPKQIASKDNCIDDSQLNGCSGYLYGNYSSRDFVCYPGNPPGIPYTVYPTVSPYNSYDLTEIVDLDLKFDNPIQRACESTITEHTVNCESNSRPTICLDGNCDYDPCHPATFPTNCIPTEESARDDQLAVLAQVFSQASHADVIYPINVYAVAFCGGEIRYLLANEMEYLSISYRIQRTLSIDEPEQRIRIDNSGEIIHGTLVDFLHQRKSSPPLIFTLAPVYDNPAPGLDPVTGDPIDGVLPEVSSPVTYYLYDHLGNTRVTFRADAPDLIAIDYAADYYPYGKVLREYKPCGPNRYLSTYHERDAETGYDNRGARLYDNEIGRFLGVDPLAGSFAPYSPYNYVLGNPVSLFDPTGAYPEDYTVYVDGQKAESSELTYWTGEIEKYQFKKAFVTAVEHAIIHDAYRIVDEDLKDSWATKAFNEFSPPNYDVSFPNLARKKGNPWTWLGGTSLTIGKYSIPIENIAFKTRGLSSALNRVMHVEQVPGITSGSTWDIDLGVRILGPKNHGDKTNAGTYIGALKFQNEDTAGYFSWAREQLNWSIAFRQLQQSYKDLSDVEGSIRYLKRRYNIYGQ